MDADDFRGFVFFINFVCLCKHSVIMADTKIIFLGAENTGTEEIQLECFYNIKNKITISILDESIDNYGYPVFLQLSKETAIKFSKELRKQISYITEMEVENG